MSRDDRQAAVYDWVVSTFGLPNATVTERVYRLFEEVVELAQAEGVPTERLFGIVAHVYGKPPGDPAQEVGGVGTTLLAYAASKGLSADELEEAELRRVLSKDPEYFRRRHNLKASAGIAEVVPEAVDVGDLTTEPAPPPRTLSAEERAALLVHAAQSEVLDEFLRALDPDGWFDGELHEYRNTLVDYVTERKRQTDSCDEMVSCGLLGRLTRELDE